MNVTDDAGHGKALRVWLSAGGTEWMSYYGTTDIVDQQWHYLAGARGNGRVRLYVGGAEQANEADYHNGIGITSSWQTIGYPGNTEQVEGIIDEVRLSLVARSAGWIRTVYNNLSSPDTFYVLGPPSE